MMDKRKAAEQFRLAIEAAPTGMLMIDLAGKIVLVNAQVEKLFGYPREELLGQEIEILVPERFRARHPQFRQAFFGDPKTRAMGSGRELYGLRKDGTEVPVEIGLNPLQTPDGEFVLSSVVDITERRTADQERENLLGQLRTLNAELEERVQERTSELSATLREREVLLREIHHRVKNNLQVISSLLQLQSGYVDNDATRKVFVESQGRIRSMALVHEKLYKTNDLSHIDFGDYVRDLVSGLVVSYGANAERVVIEVQAASVQLDVDRAIPCGLIVHELVSNCFKHGFPNQRKGRIDVTVAGGAGSAVELSVRDDGVSWAPGFDPKQSSSLGLQLVRILAKQVMGTLKWRIEDGVSCTLTLEPEHHTAHGNSS